ncbi:PspC domain-containing protein [Aerococcus viridans]|uniref:PspC domain-containing protein n=1 Tax=Aerococcus viridans TaxID=1377 RepID=UPI00223B5D17|nr:PspC domain-containing protein [Aerococcus viridans]MCT1797663.1 PspC domain-containing protein [Aerococcus viridans]
MAKKLTKSRNDVKLDGVCAGIAEYFEIDPTIIRIIFVFVTLSGGAGLLVYLLLALILPRDEGRTRVDRQNRDEYRQTKLFDAEDQDDYNESIYNKDSKDTLDEEESWRDF